MRIIYHEENKIFHIFNDKISYIMCVLKNGQMGQLYFGSRIEDGDSFDRMLVLRSCILSPGCFRGDLDYSMNVIKQEYPAYGTGDYREPAYQIQTESGSRITDFKFQSYRIYSGKETIKGMPHIYDDKNESMTLEITLYDEMISCKLILKYSIFENYGAIIRSSEFINEGSENLRIQSAMSACLDLYDSEFEMIQLDGAWARERHITNRKLANGVQRIASTGGASSPVHNPFLALKRSETTETSGEVYAFNLLYSGNFQAQAEVDSYDVTRVLIGINPFEFEWSLTSGKAFSTPEAVLVYSKDGLNGMSHTFHDLYRNNLMRGKWKEQTRPILINNWEATYFDFNEDSILKIAERAKSLGVELFVLDDGWFGKRDNDSTSLGDWVPYSKKLPGGIKGLSEKIHALGLKFGLWFEPEMVNEISDLYKEHPDWVVSVPGRNRSYGRNQFVLDFSREEIVTAIFEKMDAILSTAQIEYIKWDMNRNITEAFSCSLPPERQKEFFHRYILGVYSLYERLIEKYPDILFESCASGGGRFDAGMLYYAPQAWTSDDTDAVERLPIQYGTSMVYPIVSMGSHVAAVPNHQVDRRTNLKMRADVAYFGTFGYELDLNKLSDEEKAEVREQIEFFKKYRDVIHNGDFYRLKDGSKNIYSWMTVSKDKGTAILGYYKILATPNPSIKKVILQGLDETAKYKCLQNNQVYSASELMNFGMIAATEFTGLMQGEDFKGEYHPGTDKGDFTSQLYVFERI